MDRRFDFMPRGEHHIRRIYQAVTKRHSELCDDTYLCSASCKHGTDSPEWQHVVRAVLKNIRDRGGPVSKGKGGGLWLFGDTSGTTQLEKNFSFRPGCRTKKRSAIVRKSRQQIERDLRHNELQKLLYRRLVRQFGKENVGTEIPGNNGTSIDLVVRRKKGY
jgi:hypothetical protein